MNRNVVPGFKKRKEKSKKLLALAFFLSANFISCSVQKHVVEHTFTFPDKWGMKCGYEIQFIVSSKDQVKDQMKNSLFCEAQRIATGYGREMMVSDFYFKRDSIENQFRKDVIAQMKKKKVSVKEVKIVSLMLPTQIIDALNEKAETSKTPQPARVKRIE